MAARRIIKEYVTFGWMAVFYDKEKHKIDTQFFLRKKDIKGRPITIHRALNFGYGN